MQGDKNVRLGIEMINKLNRIRQQEEERGNVDISYRAAGEILSKRIDSVGGLREWKGRKKTNDEEKKRVWNKWK